VSTTPAATLTASPPPPATTTSPPAPDPLLEVRDADGRTPLVAATKAVDVEAARRLILAGADVNARDNLSDSAFLYAGAEGINEILVLTLSHGADVRSLNRYGGTALIPAAENGHPSTVHLLIDAGVPVDHVNDSGWTALLEALVYGDGSTRYQDVVQRLLAAGADPDIPGAQGQTAIQVARSAGQNEIVRLLGG
jgi:ankyrin repeat protein